MSKNWKRFAVSAYRFGTEKVPPVVRSIAGIVLVGLGLLGFLPILGFWMVPVGLLFIALDIPPLRRRIKGRLELR